MTYATKNLICTNRSKVTGSFCLFETGGSALLGNAWPLAWLVERVPGGGRAWIHWTEERGFAWARTGSLVPGAIFFSTQTNPIPPVGASQINLLPLDGTWSFSSPQAAAPDGPQVVRCGASLPADTLAVGLTRGGVPVLAVQAQPNVTLALQPGRALHLSFGNFRPGEVLDPALMPTSTALRFPAHETTLCATLEPDMTWSTGPATGQERWL